MSPLDGSKPLCRTQDGQDADLGRRQSPLEDHVDGRNRGVSGRDERVEHEQLVDRQRCRELGEVLDGAQADLLTANVSREIKRSGFAGRRHGLEDGAQQRTGRDRGGTQGSQGRAAECKIEKQQSTPSSQRSRNSEDGEKRTSSKGSTMPFPALMMGLRPTRVASALPV